MLHAQGHAKVDIELFLFETSIKEFRFEGQAALEYHDFLLSLSIELVLHDLNQIQLADKELILVSPHLLKILGLLFVFELIPKKFEYSLAALYLLSSHNFFVFFDFVTR